MFTLFTAESFFGNGMARFVGLMAGVGKFRRREAGLLLNASGKNIMLARGAGK